MREQAPPYALCGTLDGTSPILLSSPHSGMRLPADFATHLPHHALRRIEDAHVGRLIRPAAMATASPLLEATHARAVIDLNRAEDEYDPAGIAGPMPQPPRMTERVRAGYGLVPRIVSPGQTIAAAPVPAATVLSRIRTLHRPFHAAIATALAAARARHGYAILIDCHSMPRLHIGQRADIVLGDRHGRSADAALTSFLRDAFTGCKLHTTLNQPYAGGHITEHHGQPADGVHVVQLEIDRSLYMDTHSLIPHAGFLPLATLMADVVQALANALPRLAPHLRPVGGLSLAAE